MTDKTVTAIFCDDIRQELGNKIALMGCYQDVLLVPSLPATLPKLCAWIVVSTPLDKPFNSLSFRLVLNDNKEIAKLNIPNDDLVKMAAINSFNAANLSVRASLIMSPFQIDAEGTLQIYVDTEDETLIGPNLALRQASDPRLH